LKCRWLGLRPRIADCRERAAEAACRDISVIHGADRGEAEAEIIETPLRGDGSGNTGPATPTPPPVTLCQAKRHLGDDGSEAERRDGEIEGAEPQRRQAEIRPNKAPTAPAIASAR
jgi:hypothetical protein